MGSGLLRGGFKLKGFGAEISAPGLRKNACVAQALQSPDAPESLSFFSAGCEFSRVGCRFVIGTRLVRQGVCSVARSAWGGGFVGRTSLDDGGGGEVEEEEEEAEWTVQDSDALYRLHGWGAPYFAINVAGHLCVRPSGGTEGG